MEDICRKSPIALAYRQGVRLDLTEDLLKKAQEPDCYMELLERAWGMRNAIKKSELMKRLQIETKLTKQELNAELSKIEVIDDERPYLVNGRVNTVKAAEHIVRTYQVMRYQQEFYQYREGIWEMFPEEEVESLIHHEFKAFSKNGVISEIINAVQRESLVTPATIESKQDKFTIATANGLLETIGGNLRDFKPDDYTFKKMGAKYDPNAKCPEFMAFLDELFAGDNDGDKKKMLTQEIFGYLLIPDYTLIKKMFYLYGRKANNGKSSLLDIIRSVMGNDYFDSVPMDKLNGFLLKRLYGKHANVVGDQDANTRVPDGIIKQLVGGMDEITADVKNKDAIKFVNHARLIFAVNKLPYSEAKDEGYFTRTVILTFNNEFLPNPDPSKPCQKKAEPEKIQRIKEREKDGILNWMIEGLRRLWLNGKLTIPQSSEDALDNYKLVNSSVLLFVREECTLNPKGKINKRMLYDDYTDWCRHEGFRNIVNAHNFYDTILNEYGVEETRNNKERFLKGIESRRIQETTASKNTADTNQNKLDLK